MLDELKKKFYWLLDRTNFSIEACRRFARPEIEACYRNKHSKFEIDNAMRATLTQWVHDVAARVKCLRNC